MPLKGLNEITFLFSVGTMPKHGAEDGFYNHNDRLAKSRQLNVTSTFNNHRNVMSVVSWSVPTAPTATSESVPEVDSYDPAPMDIEDNSLLFDNNPIPTTLSNSPTVPQCTGLPGINVATTA